MGSYYPDETVKQYVQTLEGVFAHKSGITFGARQALHGDNSHCVCPDRPKRRSAADGISAPHLQSLS